MNQWSSALGALLLMCGIQWPVWAAADLQPLGRDGAALREYTEQGDWTVVMIWASDCHVCNGEAHQYVDFHTFHKDDGVQVVGISMDGKSGEAAARRFIERHQVNFPNLIGEPRQVARLYSSLTGMRWVGTPSFLVFGPDGRLQAQQVGAVPPDLIMDFIARHRGEPPAPVNAAP